MRCPKCSFISFDHRAACSRCGKDVAELSQKLNGTAIDAETPFFLAAAIETVGGESDQMGIEEGIAPAVLSETDVDFQLEPDFELSGGDAMAVSEPAVEEVELAFDAEPVAEAEEGLDVIMEAEPVAEGEEAVDVVLEAELVADEEVDFAFDVEPAVESTTEPDIVEAEEAVDFAFDAEPSIDETSEEVDLVLEDEAEEVELDEGLDLDLSADVEPESVSDEAASPEIAVDTAAPAEEPESVIDVDDDILSDLDLSGLADMDLKDSSGQDDNEEGGFASDDEDAYEDLFGELDLFDDDDDEPESSLTPSEPEDSGMTLELDQEEDAVPKKAESPIEADIPDMGLSLEKDDAD